MDAVVGAVLQQLSSEAFLKGVKAAFSYRRASAAELIRQDEELVEAYELALRLLGSILFEARSNIERVRMIEQKAVEGEPGRAVITFGILDFTVSDALMPEFCRVVTTPQVLESCRRILAMLKRVDFFQRAGVHNSGLYARGIAFARDCLGEKQIVVRFNDLVEYSHKVATAVLERGGASASRGILFPPEIDPKGPIDLSLL